MHFDEGHCPTSKVEVFVGNTAAVWHQHYTNMAKYSPIPALFLRNAEAVARRDAANAKYFPKKHSLLEPVNIFSCCIGHMGWGLRQKGHNPTPGGGDKVRVPFTNKKGAVQVHHRIVSTSSYSLFSVKLF